MRTYPWLLMGLTLLLCGCDDFDPEATFVGDSQMSHQIQTSTSDVGADGTLTANTASGSSSNSGVSVRGRQVNVGVVELTLGDFCVLQFEQWPEPNDHNFTIAATPQQRCQVELEAYSGPLLMSGTGSFRREPNLGLDVNLSGTVESRGNPNSAGWIAGTVGWSFQGTPAETE